MTHAPDLFARVPRLLGPMVMSAGLMACGDSGSASTAGNAPQGGQGPSAGSAPGGGSATDGGAGLGGDGLTGGSGVGGIATGGRHEGGGAATGGSGGQSEGGQGEGGDVGVGGAGGGGGCVDECQAEGVDECTSGTLYACTLQGPCLALTSPTPCADGFCASPTSCGTCPNECSVPQEECIDDEVRVCATDVNGCDVWGPLAPCDGACVAGTCVACEAADVNACANVECATELSARNACYGSCGVFPDSYCLAQYCADEYLALAVCLANECPGCDTPALCEAFCEQAVACFTTNNQPQCEQICQANDITYPAACGAVATCNALYTCGQLPPNSCGYDEYSCDDEAQCVSMAYRCDSTPDCADGSDEGGICAIQACGLAERDCGSGCDACPTSPEFAGYTCSAGSCVVGECTNGVPLDDACAPLTLDVVDYSATALFGPVGAVTDDFGTRRVIFSRYENDFSTSTLGTLMAERSPGGSWTVETIPFDIPSDGWKWVVAGTGSDIHMVIQAPGAFALRHVFKDASGWHEEFVNFSGGFQFFTQQVGWDSANGELVVAQYTAGRFLRRQASGWVEIPFPPGVGSYPDFLASNLVFDGGTTHFILTGFAGFATGWQMLSCSLSTSAGSCVPVVAGPQEMRKSVLRIEPSGDAHVAVHGDVYAAGGPVTLFDRVGGAWSGAPTTPLPGIGVTSQGIEAELGKLDPTHPVFAMVGKDQGEVLVAKWTGEGWQRTPVAPQPSRRFVGNSNSRTWQLIEDSNGWALALGTAPAPYVFFDGQLEVLSTSP